MFFILTKLLYLGFRIKSRHNETMKLGNVAFKLSTNLKPEPNSDHVILTPGINKTQVLNVLCIFNLPIKWRMSDLKFKLKMGFLFC